MDKMLRSAIAVLLAGTVSAPAMDIA